MKILVIKKSPTADPALEALMKAHLDQGDQVEQTELPQPGAAVESLLDALEQADKVVCWGAP